MILITGGAFQGKTAYAKSHFISETTDGAVCSPEEALSAHILTNYDTLIRRLPDAESFTKKLYLQNPDCVVILREIGCGIVPMEREERLFRETVGRCGCMLAAYSDTVIRMVCGIPTVLKGDLL